MAVGLGRAYLPHALAVKYPEADRAWAWQWVFSTRTLNKGGRGILSPLDAL
ncbi:hypothetical protein [Xenophilus sp.]|uniref:hypothetical protein n=1 Tax=Xenophilus sp. TaxID=1873499 RepID=UPI0037DC3ABC